MTKKHHDYIGSDFDDFLKEEGIYEECKSEAAKRVFVWQLEREMQKQHMSKEDLAQKMGTSRSAVDRILDPHKPSTLRSFYKAACAIGKPLRISLG
jgi:antitoxin HicB